MAALATASFRAADPLSTVHGTPPASFDEDPDLHGTMSKIPAKPKEGDGGEHAEDDIIIKEDDDDNGEVIIHDDADDGEVIIKDYHHTEELDSDENNDSELDDDDEVIIHSDSEEDSEENKDDSKDQDDEVIVHEDIDDDVVIREDVENPKLNEIISKAESQAIDPAPVPQSSAEAAKNEPKPNGGADARAMHRNVSASKLEPLLRSFRRSSMTAIAAPPLRPDVPITLPFVECSPEVTEKIWKHICSFLSPRDLCVLCCVSKSLSWLSKHDDLWSVHCLRRWNYDAKPDSKSWKQTYEIRSKYMKEVESNKRKTNLVLVTGRILDVVSVATVKDRMMTSLQVLGFDVFSDLLVEGVMTTPIVPVVLKHEVMPVMDIKPDVVSVVTRNAMKKNIPRPPCVTEEHVSLLRAGDRLYLEVMSALGKEKVTRVYLHEAPEWLF